MEATSPQSLCTVDDIGDHKIGDNAVQCCMIDCIMLYKIALKGQSKSYNRR
jgi:hypothetical protein